MGRCRCSRSNARSSLGLAPPRDCLAGLTGFSWNASFFTLLEATLNPRPGYDFAPQNRKARAEFLASNT